MSHTFHPHAEKELAEIEKYYDSQGEAISNRFRADLELAITRILRFPHSSQPLTRSIRRRRLNAFPNGVIYRLRTDEIRILAVTHLRREPWYWLGRT